jgi:hypothetical protein
VSHFSFLNPRTTIQSTFWDIFSVKGLWHLTVPYHFPLAPTDVPIFIIGTVIIQSESEFQSSPPTFLSPVFCFNWSYGLAGSLFTVSLESDPGLSFLLTGHPLSFILYHLLDH